MKINMIDTQSEEMGDEEQKDFIMSMAPSNEYFER